jgi:hypothetical protein
MVFRNPAYAKASVGNGSTSSEAFKKATESGSTMLDDGVARISESRKGSSFVISREAEGDEKSERQLKP